MEIKYLTQVEENPTLNDFTNEPFALEDIIALEKKYNHGNEFPKAFREFLFLAGEFNNFGFDDLARGFDWLQSEMHRKNEMVGLSLDREYFAFSVYSSQYSVICLEETAEDPIVYIIAPYIAEEDGTPLVDIPDGGFKEIFTFTELVNESIRRVKNNIAF